MRVGKKRTVKRGLGTAAWRGGRDVEGGGVVGADHLLLLTVTLKNFAGPALTTPVRRVNSHCVVRMSRVSLANRRSLLSILVVYPRILAVSNGGVVNNSPFTGLCNGFIVHVSGRRCNLSCTALLRRFGTERVRDVGIYRGSRIVGKYDDLGGIVSVALHGNRGKIDKEMNLFNSACNNKGNVIDMLDRRSGLHVLDRMRNGVRHASGGSLNSCTNSNSDLVGRCSRRKTGVGVL